MSEGEGGTVQRKRDLRLLGSVARAVAGVLLMGTALAVLLKHLDAVASPFTLDYREGIVLDRVRALLRGDPLYPATGGAPYISWNFPPLYAWVCAAVSSVAGPSFAAGRAVALASALAASFCIYLLVTQASRQRRWGALGALLFITQTHVGMFSATMCVDMTGLALSLCGLVVVGRGGRAMPAGLLFALGLLCKQSLLAAPLAACLHLLAARRYRDTAVLVTTMVVTGVAVVASARAAPADLWFHLIQVNADRWVLSRAVNCLLVSAPALLPTALLAAGCRWRTRAKPGADPMAWYLLTSCLAALLIGKVGSSANYLLDVSAALAVAAGRGAPGLLSVSGRRMPVGAADTLLAMILLLHVAVAYPGHGDIAPRADLAAVNEVIAQARGPVIADHPGMVSGAGQPLWLQPFEFTQMALAHRWDPSPVEAALRRGEVPLIILRDPWDERLRDEDGTWYDGGFTQGMVLAIRSAYRIERRCGVFCVLRPKSPPEH